MNEDKFWRQRYLRTCSGVECRGGEKENNQNTTPKSISRRVFLQTQVFNILLDIYIWMFYDKSKNKIFISFLPKEMFLLLVFIWDFPGGISGKESTCQCRRHKRVRFNPRVWNIPVEKEMAIHSCILAWKMPWKEKHLFSTERNIPLPCPSLEL